MADEPSGRKPTCGYNACAPVGGSESTDSRALEGGRVRRQRGRLRRRRRGARAGRPARLAPRGASVLRPSHAALHAAAARASATAARPRPAGPRRGLRPGPGRGPRGLGLQAASHVVFLCGCLRRCERVARL